MIGSAVGSRVPPGGSVVTITFSTPFIGASIPTRTTDPKLVHLAKRRGGEVVGDQGSGFAAPFHQHRRPLERGCHRGKVGAAAAPFGAATDRHGAGGGGGAQADVQPYGQRRQRPRKAKTK